MIWRSRKADRLIPVIGELQLRDHAESQRFDLSTAICPSTCAV